MWGKQSAIYILLSSGELLVYLLYHCNQKDDGGKIKALFDMHEVKQSALEFLVHSRQAKRARCW